MSPSTYTWGVIVHLVAFVICAWLALCMGIRGDVARAAIMGVGALVAIVSLFKLELRYRRERDGWPYTCTRCGYAGFRSKDGRLVAGTCPNPVEVRVPIEGGTWERATAACPLIPRP